MTKIPAGPEHTYWQARIESRHREFSDAISHFDAAAHGSPDLVKLSIEGLAEVARAGDCPTKVKVADELGKLGEASGRALLQELAREPAHKPTWLGGFFGDRCDPAGQHSAHSRNSRRTERFHCRRRRAEASSARCSAASSRLRWPSRPGMWRSTASPPRGSRGARPTPSTTFPERSRGARRACDHGAGKRRLCRVRFDAPCLAPLAQPTPRTRPWSRLDGFGEGGVLSAVVLDDRAHVGAFTLAFPSRTTPSFRRP